MAPRTIFLARLIGLYYLLAAAAMAIHKQETVETIYALMRNPPVVFLTAVIAIFAGLALVLGHNVWTGGALPIVVTVIGWITLAKGLIIFFVSPQGAAAILDAVHYQQNFYYFAGISLCLGIYLTYGGFARRA